ncbi:Mdm33 family-domain-containing protein [Thermothelomyces heterothallicus CBS 202.75]|uniref:Mdm33 family-domain-containing protein n=1 Tax=Thermothelomyces heterothallicus CBS 202.75 TaxID=1149848 RepID=UPI0037448EB3
MSAHTALRLAVRPLKRATLLDQIATTAVQKPVRQRPRSQLLCLCCSIAVGPEFESNPARTRFFSTAPPPPRNLPPSLESIVSRKPEPESTAAKDASPAASSSSPPSEPSDQPLQPDPEQSAPSSSPSSSSSSSSEPTASVQPSNPESKEPPGDSAPPEPESRSQDSSLPSFTETHRHPLSARFSTFMDNLQARVLTATQTINDLTGYSAIEAIKKRNGELEREHAAAQQRLRAARHNYKSLTTHRAATQREVTALLARKDTWTPADLERFTTLYRSDHELEAQVGAAAAELTEAEADEARLSGELNAGILKRYHEEQIWSDRIRRQSTWGTWGLMGVNVVLFLVLQFVAEPWRRRRLVNGIAEREKGFMDEVRRELVELKAASQTAAAAATSAAAAAAALTAPAAGSGEGAAAHASGRQGTGSAARDGPDVAVPMEPEDWRLPRKPWKEVLMDFWEDPELLREAVLDLTSDRRIDLRMRDASLLALQGAAAGATLAVVLAVSILRST